MKNSHEPPFASTAPVLEFLVASTALFFSDVYLVSPHTTGLKIIAAISIGPSY